MSESSVVNQLIAALPMCYFVAEAGDSRYVIHAAPLLDIHSKLILEELQQEFPDYAVLAIREDSLAPGQALRMRATWRSDKAFLDELRGDPLRGLTGSESELLEIADLAEHLSAAGHEVMGEILLSERQRVVTPDQETPASSVTKSGEGEGAGNSGSMLTEPAVPAGTAKEEALRKLEPAVMKAYLAFRYAEKRNEKQLKDWEAHKWLLDNGIDQDRDDSGELTDYEAPALDTFTRYLSTARTALDENKHTQRRGRKHGRSIVQASEIEQRGRTDG